MNYSVKKIEGVPSSENNNIGFKDSAILKLNSFFCEVLDLGFTLQLDLPICNQLAFPSIWQCKYQETEEVDGSGK